MSSLIFPPFLHPGDKVAVVSPSGKIDKTLLKGGIQRLISWGYQAVAGRYAGKSCGRYAGTIKQRLEDLQWAMDDPSVRAILCSRGGYGAVHLLSGLDMAGFCSSPKWLIGFSDITVLHNLIQKHGFASLHAPMARHLTVEAETEPSMNYLRAVLAGKLPEYKVPGHRLNRKGKTAGILRGGNMAVFSGLRGTPYDIPPEGTVLFIEDVGERPHAIERMMYNLKLGGVLERLSGLVIGQFTEYDEDHSLGKDVYGALADLVEEYDYPVCFNFPVGHVTANYPLICGAEVVMEVDNKQVSLRFV